MDSPVVSTTHGSPTFRTLDVGLLRVTEARFAAHHFLESHAHSRPVVAVILAGSWEEQLGSRVHHCLPGTLQVEPPEECHTNRFHDAGARVLVIEPDPDQETLFSACHAFLTEPSCFDDPGLHAMANRLALEVNNPDNLSTLAVEGIAVDLLASAARLRDQRRDAGAPPAWLLSVQERLHAEFVQPPRLEELARVAGVHPMHLTRGFRRLTGMSVGGYVRRLRLEWCADRLVHSSLPLSEIALRAGYSDQSHFTREFHRWSGLTPRGYRQARSLC